jgi:hypothetical protein
MVRQGRTIAILAALAAITALGCGGKQQGDRPYVAPWEPDETVGGELPEEGAVADTQRLEEIRRAFDRRSRLVGRCFSEAVDAGEIPASASGTVTVELVITPAGKATKVRVTQASLKSDTLHRCVVQSVERMSLPNLSRDMDYSYRFGFEWL